MKKTLCLFLIFLTQIYPVYAGRYMTSSVRTEIRNTAKKKWPKDYSMQEYEIEKQSEAFENIQSMVRPAGISLELFNVIKNRVKSIFPGDYNMQEYKIKEQIDAFNELQKMTTPNAVPRGVFSEIKAAAQKKWPDDYGMQIYEIKNQVESWMKINS